MPDDPRIELLIEELEKCGDLGPEQGHQMADYLLLGFIGNEKVIAAFEKLNKWYA
jgi:hypothetical protein